MIQLPDSYLRGDERGQALLEFSNALRSLQAEINFKVSSRGWCSCGQKTHPPKDINTLASPTSVPMPVDLH